MSGHEQICEADTQLESVRLYDSGNPKFDWIIDVLGLVDKAGVQPCDALERLADVAVSLLHPKG